MGNEAQCRVEIGGEAADAKALLETEELIVRGALRAKIPFRETKDVAADHPGRAKRLTEQALKWRKSLP